MIRKGTIAATGILLLLFACPVSSQTVTIPLTYLYGHPISIKNKPAKCPGKNIPIEIYYNTSNRILTIIYDGDEVVSYSIYNEMYELIEVGLINRAEPSEIYLPKNNIFHYYIEIDIGYARLVGQIYLLNN